MSDKTPKGILVAIGGREDKGFTTDNAGSGVDDLFKVSGVLKEITSLLSGSNPRIEVFTTASAYPQEMRDTYKYAFGRLGFHNIGFNHMETGDEAEVEDALEKIRNADCLFMTGGSQDRLFNIKSKSRVLTELKDLYENKEIVIAGTSAGAMVMSELMISQVDEDGEQKMQVNIKPGFSFIKNVIIDTHFANRGRYWRLAEAIARNPGCVGIGLDENTAVCVREGRFVYVIGYGLVSIIETRESTSCYTTNREKKDCLSIENLVTHILSKGDWYDLQLRKTIVSPEKLQDGYKTPQEGLTLH